MRRVEDNWWYMKLDKTKYTLVGKLHKDKKQENNCFA